MPVSFLKRSTETLDYDFDFSDIVPTGDSIQSDVGTSTVTVPSGLTAGTKTHNTSTSIVKQYISGGTDEASYTVTCTLTTTVGRIITREITILVGITTVSVTPAEISSHIETDLNQETIQRYIDDAEEDIIARYGAHASQVDYLEGGGVYLFLTRPVSSVTSIIETIGEDDTTLASNDYVLQSNGWKIKRLTQGTTGRRTWAPEVKVTYTPVDDRERRRRVVIDLVRLAIEYSALESVRDGDHPETFLNYQQERERLLRGLLPRTRIVA